jgi:hypothetical protein
MPNLLIDSLRGNLSCPQLCTCSTDPPRIVPIRHDTVQRARLLTLASSVAFVAELSLPSRFCITPPKIFTNWEDELTRITVL